MQGRRFVSLFAYNFMKKLITVFLLFTLIQNSIAQERQLLQDSASGKYAYTEVVNSGNTTKDQLYSAALKWYTSNFDKALLQISNSDRLYGDAFVKIKYMMKEMPVRFTVDIQIKDGKYKYTITDFVVDDKGGAGRAQFDNYPKTWAGKKKIFEKTAFEMDLFIENLKKSLVAGVADNNW